MAKIYTKSGDDGMTSLIGGKRVLKSHTLVEIYGSIDELSAFIGVLYDIIDAEQDKCFLMHIQECLLQIEAYYASETSCDYDINLEEISAVEYAIDILSSRLPTFGGFVLAGGCLAASYAHVCRTVCRRCERLIVCYGNSSNSLKYLNRLSDYFFVLSRYLQIYN